MTDFLFYIVNALGLVPIIYLYINKRKINYKSLYILPFAILTFFSSLYEMITSGVNYNTAYWFRLYLLLEFITLFYYYYKINLNDNKYLLKGFILYLSLYGYLLFIWDLNTCYKTDSFLTIYEFVFVLIGTVLWFRKVFGELSETSLLSSPDYYFIAGFLLYFSGTFFLFLMCDYILKNATNQFLNYWNLNILFSGLLRILLIIGIWKVPKSL